MDRITGQIDALFKSEDEEVHPLERAARLCMQEARDARSVWLAMTAQSCAIRIRSLPEWRMYQKRTG